MPGRREVAALVGLERAAGPVAGAAELVVELLGQVGAQRQGGGHPDEDADHRDEQHRGEDQPGREADRRQAPEATPRTPYGVHLSRPA